MLGTTLLIRARLKSLLSALQSTRGQFYILGAILVISLTFVIFEGHGLT